MNEWLTDGGNYSGNRKSAIAPPPGIKRAPQHRIFYMIFTKATTHLVINMSGYFAP